MPNIAQRVWRALNSKPTSAAPAPDAINARANRPLPGPIAAPDKWFRSLLNVGSELGELTPENLLSILRLADLGDIRRQMLLYEAMEERDTAIMSHLPTRKSGLLACGWELQPPDKDRKRKYSQAAINASMDLCDQVLDGIPKFKGALLDYLDAVGKGFSVMEITWDTSAKNWWPTAIEYRPQRWFRLNSLGELRLLDSKSFDGIELNPFNFNVHIHKARSGNLARGGLLRGLARPFLIRNYALKDWGAYAEKFGMPAVKGTLPQGTTAEQREAFGNVLKNFSTEYWALLYEGWQVELMDVGKGGAGSATIFERLLSTAKEDMVIAILGQPLTTTHGQHGGSLALGKVQENVRFDLIDDDGEQLEETIQQQLLKPIVRFNLGEDAPVPELHFKRVAPQDSVQKSQTIKNLTDAGVKISQKWARGEFEIPDPEPGEELLTPTPAANPFGRSPGDVPATQQLPPPTTPGGKAPNASRQIAETPDGQTPGRAGALSRTSPRTRAQQQARIATQRAAHLETMFSHFRPDARGYVADLKAQVVNHVRKSPSIESALSGLPTLRKALPGLDWLAQPMLLGLLAGNADVKTGAAKPIPSPALSAALAAEPTAPMMAMDLPPQEAIDWFRSKGVVTPEQFAALDAAAKARAFTASGLQDDYVLNAMKDSLQQALEQGQTVNQWLGNIEDLFTRTGLSELGDIPMWRLRNIYRQNIFEAYSAGRWQQMQLTKTARPYLMYLTMEDDLVRPEHAALDRIVKPMDDPFWDSYYPPWDWNCRCLVVSMDEQDLAEEGINDVTSDDEISRAYAAEMKLSGVEIPPQMPPSVEEFAGNPAQRFGLN